MSSLYNFDERADNVELGQPKPETGSGKVQEDQSQEDYIRELYGQIGERPKPAYDPDREKRLQTMAGAGGVAKALSVLGDVFGASQGAMVKPNEIQPDNYINQILQDRKDYQDKLDTSEQQRYLDSIRQASGLASARAADVSTKEAARRFDITQEQQAARDAESARRFDITETRQTASDEALAEYRQNQLDLQRDKMVWDQLQTESTKTGKLFDLITPDGKTKIPVEEAGELQAIYSAILNDKDPKLQADAMSKLQIMRSKLEGMNSNDLKNFVQEFWHRSPEARRVIEGLRGTGETTPPPPSVSIGMPWLTPQQSSVTPIPYRPTAQPAAQPTAQPTAQPAAQPTAQPAAQPTSTQVDRSALKQAIQAKDAASVRKILSGQFKEEDVNAFLKSRGIEETTADTQDLDSKYPEKIAKKIKKGSMYANWAKQVASDLADEKGLEPGSEERRQFIETTEEEVKADHAAYKASNKGEGPTGDILEDYARNNPAMASTMGGEDQK